MSFDDAWVAENTDYSTVEEYRAAIQRAELDGSNEPTADNNLQNDAMQQVADGCTFTQNSEYPISPLAKKITIKRYTAYLQNLRHFPGRLSEQYADRATYNQRKQRMQGTMAKVPSFWSRK